MFLVDSKQELDSLKMQLPGFDELITAAHSIVSVPAIKMMLSLWS